MGHRPLSATEEWSGFRWIMVTLSETEWTAFASTIATIAAALFYNPRALQVGILQRRKWIQVLTRLSPVVRGFYAKLPGPSKFGRAVFLAAALSIMIATVLIKSYVTDPYYLTLAIFSLFFVPHLTGIRIALSSTRELRSGKDAIQSPGALTERHWRGPAVIWRVLGSMIISDIFSGFLVLDNLGTYTISGSWFFVAILVIFAPIYLVQTVDFLSIIEDLLFRSYLASSEASVPVAVYIAGGGSDCPDAARGTIVGIGRGFQLQRDDGYIEETGWELIWRLAVKQ